MMDSMTQRDEERLEALKVSLTEVGPFRHGTVLRRFMRCRTEGCHCHTDPSKLHGPYYEWTRKVEGKTVTVRLTPEQAELVGQWIANSRRIDVILAEMERVSARLTEPLLKAAGKPPRAG